MKKRLIAGMTLMAFSSLAITAAPYAQASTSHNDSNIVFYHRDSVAGPSDEVLPSGNNKGHADTKALAALQHASFVSQLVKDFSSGKCIVIDGNDDGKLDITLLSKVLGFEFSDSSDAAKGLAALAVYKDSNGVHMMEFDEAGQSHNWNHDTIRNSLANWYNPVGTPAGTMQPNSSPSGSLGNYSYYHDQLYASSWGNYADFRYGYVIKYMGHGTNGDDIWGVHLDNISTPGAANSTNIPDPTENSAIWGSIIISDYSSTETLLHDQYPANEGSSSQQSISITFTEPPTLSWSYAGDSTPTTVTISDHSSVAAGQAAWSWSFPLHSNMAKSTYFYQPGADFDVNKYATFFQFKTDNSLSYWSPVDGTVSSRTGDLYDTVTVGNMN